MQIDEVVVREVVCAWRWVACESKPGHLWLMHLFAKLQEE